VSLLKQAKRAGEADTLAYRQAGQATRRYSELSVWGMTPLIKAATHTSELVGN